MKVHICFVLCVLAIYVNECDNLKILKKIHDFLHPSEPTTTLVPVVPTYTTGEDYRGEVGRTGTTPWVEEGVTGPSESFSNGLTTPKNYYNNENENQHVPPNPSLISTTTQPFQDKHIENFETKESRNILPATQSSLFSNTDETLQSINNVNTHEENNGDNTLPNSGKQLFPPQHKNDRKSAQDFPTTTASFQNVHDYVTKTVQKQPTDIHNGHSVSNTNYNKQPPINNNNRQKLLNNGKEPNRNPGYLPSETPEEEYQPTLDSNKQQNYTTKNQFQPNTTNQTISNQKKNQLTTQIPFEENGPIVFPTEDESGAYTKPTRKDVEDGGNTNYLHAESTTLKTANVPEPVPVDGGRVVINAPSKIECPEGSLLDEGVCREIAS